MAVGDRILRAFRNVQDNHGGLFDPDGGRCRASQVDAVQVQVYGLAVLGVDDELEFSGTGQVIGAGAPDRDHARINLNGCFIRTLYGSSLAVQGNRCV